MDRAYSTQQPTDRTDKIRISIDTKDRGWRADSHRFDVWLDGVKTADWVTADEEQGLVVCVRRDDAGALIYDHSNKGTAISTFERRGRVEIRRKPDGEP